MEKLVKAGGVLAIVLTAYVGILALGELKGYRHIGGGVPGSNVITVSGEGEVFAVPDIAELTFEVAEEASTLDAAQEAAAEKMNAIIAFLEEEGIDERDIKTTYYSANPKYEWTDQPTPLGAEIQAMGYGGGTSGSAGVSSPDYYYPQPRNQVIVGYEVRQSVAVKVRDTDKAGEILSGAGSLGATNMYGPTFTIDDEDELQRQARKAAIEDAREKARELARDLDVKLVRVVSFSESGGGYYPMYRGGIEMMAYDSDEAKAIPELPVGENSITAYVTITYEIR